MAIVYIVWFVLSLLIAIRVAVKSGGHPTATAVILILTTPGIVLPSGILVGGTL